MHIRKAAAAGVMIIALGLQACKKSNSSAPPPTPVITGISPDTAAFDVQLTISGNNFSQTIANDIVKINGVPATVQTVTPSSMVVTVPKGAGTGAVTVSVNGMTATGPVLNYTYTYTVSTLAGNGTAGYQDGPAATAEFNDPYGVTADAQGNVYVADYYNHRIRKISSGTVTTIAGNGTSGFQDGAAGTAEFNSPAGLAVDAQGNIYVADEVNNRIRKIASGTVSTLAGDGNPGFADSSLGGGAEFHYPFDVAVDAQENVFVADYANDCIRKITSAGSVSTIAGSKTHQTGHVDGPGAGALFFEPSGISIDAQGNLFIGDQDNNCIRKITTADIVSTVSGGGFGGFVDGPVSSAQFNLPSRICPDAQGNLYVGDNSNHRIRMITPAGIVSTIAGNGIGSFADGIGVNAELAFPRGVAVDAQGNIYVADSGNNRIRKITVE